MRKVLVSPSARKDFAEIRSYVVKKFGASHWNQIVGEWQDIFRRIAQNPETGSSIAELSGTGYANYRRHLHKNAYAVYSYNDREVRVHMFIPGMRDFRTHVIKRIYSE